MAKTTEDLRLVAEAGAVLAAEKPGQHHLESDAASFLPYKSYALLDTAWIRTSFKSSARIAGPNGQSWELFLTVDVDAPSKDKLVVHEFSVHSLTGEGMRTGGALLSTSFSLVKGETVIVGTSKLDGPSKAVVVLLTAIP